MARKTGSHGDITGPAIRAAALSLFARSGYAAVSMRELASEVGVQAGALYLYTPDKQTLLFDMLRDNMQRALEAWEDARIEGTPAEQLETFVRFHVNYHVDRSDEIYVAYMELRNLTPENFEQIEGLRRDYEAEVEAILVAGQKSGDFKLADIRVSTMALIAMLNGVMTWYREGGRLSRGRIQQIYWDMAKQMVLALSLIHI